jgi:hypothetical protein
MGPACADAVQCTLDSGIPAAERGRNRNNTIIIMLSMRKEIKKLNI